MRQNLSLAQLKIAEPCSQDWDSMSGDAQKKFCEGCQKHVHNLSAMTLSAAEQLLCESAGHLCVRYDFNPDGSVKTLDYEPAPAARRGWKFWTVIGTGLATLVAGGQAMVKPTPPPTKTTTSMLLGEVAYQLPTTAPAPLPTPLGSAMGGISARDPGEQPGPPPIMGKPAPPPPPVPTTRSTE